MQNFRALGAPPPDPHWPPASGGSAPRPPKQPPHCEFLATRLVSRRNQARRQRGCRGAMPPPIFVFAPPPRFISCPPPQYFLGRNKLLFLPGKNVKICDFGQKKPSDFGEDLFFGDHLIFTKTSPQSNSRIMKKLCPPDFNFAPRSREAGDAPGCNHVL